MSKKLSEVNPYIDESFISKTIKMKAKPKRNEEVDPENLDEEGFRDIEAVGVYKQMCLFLLIFLYKQVFCSDCDKIVSEVMTIRDMTPESTDVQCGFDSGQGVLKLAVTLPKRGEPMKTGRG